MSTAGTVSANTTSPPAVDYSRLKDADLDTVQWINSMFQASSPQSSLSGSGAEQEAFATSVVMKLQLYIQEVEKHVEDIMQSVSASVPRVIRDVESLRHETMMLHNQMSQVSNEVGALCTDTKESMRVLVRLDLEHERISQVLKFIEQADSWSTLTQQLEDSFLMEDIDGVSQKMIALIQCVEAARPLNEQSFSSEFESRKSTLDNLKNRTETLLSSLVIECVSQENWELFQKYKNILISIDREESVFKFYYQYHKNNFQKVWSEIYAEGYNDDKVADLLTLCFSELQTLVEKQHSFIEKVCSSSAHFVKEEKAKDSNESQKDMMVFENKNTKLESSFTSGYVTCELATQCVLALEPSITAVVKQSLDSIPHKEVLPALKDINYVEKSFVENVKIIASQSSVRLEASVYASLVPVLLNYNRYLYEQLLPTLSGISSSSSKDVHQVSNSIEESRQLVEKHINGCLELCDCVSDNLAILNVVSVLEDQFFVAYINRISDIIDKSSKRLGFEKNVNNSSQNNSPSNVVKPSIVAEDWTMFQNSVKLTEVMGRIKNCVSTLEKTIIGNHLLSPKLLFLVENSSVIDKSGGSTQDSVFNYLKVWNHQAWMKLQDTVKLAQSSKDLVRLFPKSSKGVEKLIGKCQKLAVNCILEYPRQQFVHMQNLSEWCKMSEQKSSSVFSLSPLEYVTRVGQYIMSLPAQLEVLESTDEIQQVFLNSFITDSVQGDFKVGDLNSEEEKDSLCETWLCAIVQELMKLYLDNILSIDMITNEGARQLNTDINYLQNVLDDFSLKLSDDLCAFLRLINSPMTEFNKLQDSVPQKLFITVKSQRR